MPEQSFSHRPTTSGAKPNKPFKSRHASKGQQKLKGKVSTASVAKRPSVKSTTSKADRKNIAKLIQREKRLEIMASNRLFASVPKIISLVPLCRDTSSERFLKTFEKSSETNPVLLEYQKQSFQFIANKRNLLDILDSVKVADYVCFLVSAKEEVDHFGDLCIKAIQDQGVPLVITVVQVGSC